MPHQHNPTVPLPPDAVTLFNKEMLSINPDLGFHNGVALSQLQVNQKLLNLYFSQVAQDQMLLQVRAWAQAEAKRLWDLYRQTLSVSDPCPPHCTLTNASWEFYLEAARVLSPPKWFNDLENKVLLRDMWHALSDNEKALFEMRENHWLLVSESEFGGKFVLIVFVLEKDDDDEPPDPELLLLLLELDLLEPLDPRPPELELLLPGYGLASAASAIVSDRSAKIRIT
ncbi:hypothetical protein EST38_g2047 [Candolleomyces aberdarensis]|uniref:Uncharacterized protein n=1 Tax=Candolleomyces aberdarensis TaxID=2316362 RepID=A0A4Q2DTG2_9AGAR|nr:hypothetical protein EST38_g2047 [Candolleomyces aberdarensis]